MILTLHFMIRIF